MICVAWLPVLLTSVLKVATLPRAVLRPPIHCLPAPVITGRYQRHARHIVQSAVSKVTTSAMVARESE